MYWGKLPPPKSKKGQPAPVVAGAPNEEGVTESEDLLLFRSSRHGDEVDRPVKKADGTPTYFCADIAYHWDKRQRADLLIDVLGADHGGYVPRLEAALEALGASRRDLHVVLIQMVNLTRGGEAVKMSKRAGTVVSLQEVVDEVGCDATRFIFLTRRGRRPARLRPGAGQAPDARQPGLLRPVRPRPAVPHPREGGRGRRPGGALRRGDARGAHRARGDGSR